MKPRPRCEPCGIEMYFDIYGGGYVCLDCGSGAKTPAREDMALGYRAPIGREARIIEEWDAAAYERDNPIGGGR